MADTLAFVSRMVSSAATSDEDFASTLDDTAPRVLQNLRSFLEVVSKGNANLRMETGDARFELNAQQAKQAYDRVSGTITNESDVQLRGVFRGATLDSWRFDFTDAEGLRLSGQLGDDVGPEEAEELLQKYFNKQCVARLHKSTVVFKNGRVRTSYKLLSLT